MLSKIAWTSLGAAVLVLVSIVLGVVSYVNEDMAMALLAIVVALGGVSLSVLSYREV